MLGPDLLAIHLDPTTAVGLVVLGLIGGILGGFIGGGGAFVITPGLMSLGSEGLVAVGTNLLHRLGRMATSARRRAALRNVDGRLLVALALPALVGVEGGRALTAWLRGRFGVAAADLYVGLVMVLVLGVVTRMLVQDLLRSRGTAGGRAAPLRPLSAKSVAQRIRPLLIPPVIRFPVANVVVSLWLVLGIGLLSGWLAGSIALGGFIAVPAMIYLLGVPASIAIATDMGLVVIVGGYGAVSYAVRGYADLRATLLLYAGSILGFYLGMLGTRLLREEPVRIVTCVVLALVALSRVLALPLTCAQGGWLGLGLGARASLHVASLGLLYCGGCLAVAMVVGAVVRAAFSGHVGLAGVGLLGREDD